MGQRQKVSSINTDTHKRVSLIVSQRWWIDILGAPTFVKGKVSDNVWVTDGVLDLVVYVSYL